MSFLPKEAVTLTGGCYCKSIRYTIKVPSWEDRPRVPGALETPISSTQKIETRMPVIDLDHCDTCRRAAGCVVQCWFICPVDWIEWDLLPKENSGNTERRDSEQGQPLHRSTVDAVGPLDEAAAAAAAAARDSPATYITRFACTDRATRTFCSRCGTTLTYLSHKRLGTPAAIVDVTVGSLDSGSFELARPDRHGWWESGVEWVKTLLGGGDGGFLIRHATGDITQAVKG